MKVWPLIHIQLAESTCGGRGRELPGVSFIRALIPFVRAPSSWPYHPPKALPPNIITLGIGFQHMDCGEKVAKPSVYSTIQTKVKKLWDGLHFLMQFPLISDFYLMLFLSPWAQVYDISLDSYLTEDSLQGIKEAKLFTGELRPRSDVFKFLILSSRQC